ncbi:ROK family glucokinase [Corynebacterium poyangense]|uniref:Glucokinase n=1 Tax=Corynebacterium poyangense TaxID=2684405 RepID=A0A7H0SPV1_9CORY|nr:ROK family glucokinase [Corynebacterium poyangense]MBZ8178168.1 ROK family glucokinase [Corynebacterium poyangense]QNQ90576.1 ROK family glucokinase [Corynebacterium poyangense]
MAVASTAGTSTIGFDIGGTNMRAGVVTADGKILEQISVPTPRSSSGMEEGIAELVAELSAKHRISGVGLAVAGFLDPECEIVRFAPHLPWRDTAVRPLLEDLLGLPVRLEHDANSAAWGEHVYGAAQGVRNWVLLAIGTGIGATIMINGEIFRGAYGTAPEFGHVCVVPNGRPCACGKSGCLERYCSGTALVDTAKDMAHDPAQHWSASKLHDRICRGEPITGRSVTEAAYTGDPLALAVMEDFAYWLGEAFAMVADVIDPELIVLGGGVSAAADLYLDTATTQFSQRIVGAGYRPLARVVRAELGADAGMIGVADLARHRARAALCENS